MKNMKLVGPGMMAVGLYFGYQAYEKAKASEQLQKEGVVVTGKVVAHEVDRGRRRMTKYYLTTQFASQDGKTEITENIEVPSSVHESIVDNQEVKVRHLASDPEVAEIEGAAVAGNTDKATAGLLLGIGGIASLIGFVFQRSPKPAPEPDIPTTPDPTPATPGPAAT